ncbi:hypothetical protein AB0O05_01210 [Streptomyces sp. NPDC093084]|uniref:hypothetical protein n=1 Tax=Streptomyces sp. NPDC093084 TaxID=3155197 RepID=UPI00342DCA5F
MTTSATQTLVRQDADLLQRLHSVLSEHPAGSLFRLLFAPEDLDSCADEILALADEINRGAAFFGGGDCNDYPYDRIYVAPWLINAVVFFRPALAEALRHKVASLEPYGLSA